MPPSKKSLEEIVRSGRFRARDYEARLEEPDLEWPSLASLQVQFRRSVRPTERRAIAVDFEREARRLFEEWARDLSGQDSLQTLIREQLGGLTGGAGFALFCERFLVQTKGRWAGRPLLLEPWQRVIADGLLEEEDGVRRYREALIGLARKNGKSTLCSALALWFLVVESTRRDPGAEVYSAAASKEQARIVFRQALEMVETSAALRAHCRATRDAIVVPESSSFYRVVASDAPRQHGLNPSAVIVDELHAHRDEGELYYALRTGSLAREQPLIVSITTAGYDLATIAGQVYERGMAGDEDLFFHWLTVSDEEIGEPAAWKRANPASWITVKDLEREARSLPRPVFERLHTNRWTAAEGSWLPAGAWDACQDGDMVLEAGDEVVLGVDMGLKHDTAAVVTIGARDDRVVVRARSWGVQEEASRPPSAHVAVTGDDRIDFGLVENHIRDQAREFDLEHVAYDPWRFERSAQDLTDEGIVMVEFPQTNERMCPASQALFDAIMERRIAHDGDPVLRAHIEAAVAKDTGRGWRLTKKGTTRPNDLAVALVIALATLDVQAAAPSLSLIA